MKSILFPFVLLFVPFFSIYISASDISRIGAYTMPYVRYDSSEASFGKGTARISTDDRDLSSPASEASGQEYLLMHKPGDYVEWKVVSPARGLVIRFTLPDDEQGEGQAAQLDIFVNGEKVNLLAVSSHFAYQYFTKGTPYPEPAPGRIALMRFDEARLLLNKELRDGDVLKICLKDGASAGIDFIELEPVDSPVRKPENALSVTDFGAKPNDDRDDFQAFVACINKAVKVGKSVYIPEGEFTLSDKLELNTDGIVITGAGMWYTSLYFSSKLINKGGFRGNASNLYVGHLFMHCANSTRMDNGKNRNYKAFSGTWRGTSMIEYVWEQHFTVGIWTAGYRGEPLTDGLHVRHVRLRNNYADGVNFAHGSSNCIFEYSDVRNCGDDGIASFSSASPIMKHPNTNNIFRWNTVEFGWRASGIGIFGGSGHHIHHIYVGEHIGSSGIRFTSDFPGNGLDPFTRMKVSDCVFYQCGSRTTLYGQLYGAIELHGKGYPIRGIDFENIIIKDAQMDGIRVVGNKVGDITFRNIQIDGTGADGKTTPIMENAQYRGAAVFCDRGKLEEADNFLIFENLTYKNSYDGGIVNVNNGYRIITNDNNNNNNNK